MSEQTLDSVFGALVILSPDKRGVLAVGQDSVLRTKVSVRFPGRTVESYSTVSPHTLALIERVVSLDGDVETRVLRAMRFQAECIQSVEETNWGSDVNTLILDELELHGKSFLCYVMTDAFNWDLVRKEVTPKPSDDWLTSLLAPKIVPLADMANPPLEFTVPKAHQVVARKLLAVLEERVYMD